MVVAFIYPTPIAKTDILDPASHEANVVAFLRRLVKRVEKCFVFFLPAQGAPERLRALPGLCVESTTEMHECLRDHTVDVWHDFGYVGANGLARMRESLGMDFCITADRPLQPSSAAISETFEGWSDHDSIVWPSPRGWELSATQGRSSGRSAFSPSGHTVQHCGIAPGFDLNAVKPCSKPDARLRSGIKADEIILLHYATFSSSSRARLANIIHSLRGLFVARGNVRLLISGPDPARCAGELKRHFLTGGVGSQVLFMPNPEPAAVELVFSAADVLLQPPGAGTREAILTTLFAMAHKQVVVAPRQSISDGLIEHQVSGWLVPEYGTRAAFEHLVPTLQLLPADSREMLTAQTLSFDGDQLVESLLTLVNNAPLRRALGLAACQRLRKTHAMVNTVDNYLQLWARLRENRRHTRGPTSAAPRRDNRSSREVPARSILAGARRLRITPLGNAALRESKIPIQSELAECIYPDIVVTLLELAESEPTIDRAAKALLHAASVTSSSVLRSGIDYHIAWCLCHGLLAASDGRGHLLP